MEDRKLQILQAIVKEFIQTAEPVGSNTILVSYNFHVSPATIRNDMAHLEHEGLLFQPHTSAGRVPTSKGYRQFVDKLIDYDEARKEAKMRLAQLQEAYAMKKVKERIYDAVTLLTQATDNLSFATLANNRTFYLGLSNVMKQPEFQSDSMFATQVVEVIEDNDNFLNILHNLPIDDTVKTFIGEENIFEKLKSCSMIVTNYHYKGFDGYIGLLGPTRMRYAYNTVCLEEIVKVLNAD